MAEEKAKKPVEEKISEETKEAPKEEKKETPAEKPAEKAKEAPKKAAPQKSAESIYDIIEKVREMNGLISKGTNETTKEIERGKAKLVVVAEDVSPPEIVMHLGPLCQEKGNIPLLKVPSKEELGRAAGLDVSTASIAIVDSADAKKEFIAFLESLQEKK